MNRTITYKLKPTISQIDDIEFNIQCANLVRNVCIKKGDIEKAKISAKSVLDEYRGEYCDLQYCDYSALMNSLFMLQTEISPKEKAFGVSYSTTVGEFIKTNFPIKDDKVFLPKIGWVKYIKDREIPRDWIVFKYTIKRIPTNEYFIYIDCEVKKKQAIVNDKSIKALGLDYSSTYFIVDSNGHKYTIPHFYRDMEKKISKKKRELNRKEEGSNNYHKLKEKVAKLEYHVSKQREDFLHKLSCELADTYDVISVEKLNMVNISKNYNLAKTTLDNSYSMFLHMLNYKMEDRGKKLIIIDRWFPSSKTCSNCGGVIKTLPLKVRVWTCPYCSSVLDRDINAAINIKNEGLKIFNNSLGERNANA